MRQELGVRNVFHPIARLLNPARAASQVVGLTHPPHFEKTAEALRMLGLSRALVIRGVEGDPELSHRWRRGCWNSRRTHYPVGVARRMPDWRWRRRARWRGILRNSARKEADLLRRILRNQVPGGPTRLGAAECGMLLYAGGKGASSVGVFSRHVARRALEDGSWGASSKNWLDQTPVVA